MKSAAGAMKDSNYAKNRSSFVSVSRDSIYEPRRKISGAEGEGEGNHHDQLKDCDIDAVSSSGFGHPKAQVISPTGDDALKNGEQECMIHDNKRVKGFQTIDE